MARRDSFDFPYTCPRIDKAIDSCKDTLEICLSGYIKDLFPYVPSAEVVLISIDWSKQIYDAISDCFESVRQTNEEMRDEANRQIEDLEDEISNLKYEVKSLESRLDAVS